MRTKLPPNTTLQSHSFPSAHSKEEAEGPRLFPRPQSHPHNGQSPMSPSLGRNHVTGVAYTNASDQQYLATLSHPSPHPLPQYATHSAHNLSQDEGDGILGCGAPQNPALKYNPSDTANQAVSNRVAPKSQSIPLLRRIFPGIWPHPSTLTQKQSSLRREYGTRSTAHSSFAKSSSHSHPTNGNSQASSFLAPMGISHLQYLITGGCLLLAFILMADMQAWLPQAEAKEICQAVVQPNAILSRDHLAKVLAVSERSAKTTIQQVVAEPYCRMPSVSIRAGVVADREAYPLAFDPDTWLIMLYEGDEYAGFDFSFRK
ncbi:MAG: hypothetical protein AAGD25_25050 [Cyanobacteria bacterium P01_F01_bin.150]